MHAVGWAHRDIKFSNILIRDPKSVAISGFDYVIDRPINLQQEQQEVALQAGEKLSTENKSRKEIKTQLPSLRHKSSRVGPAAPVIERVFINVCTDRIRISLLFCMWHAAILAARVPRDAALRPVRARHMSARLLLYRMLEGHMPFGEPFKAKSWSNNNMNVLRTLANKQRARAVEILSVPRPRQGATRNGSRALPAGPNAKFAANNFARVAPRVVRALTDPSGEPHQQHAHQHHHSTAAVATSAI